MKKLYRFIVVPLIVASALVGCKNDKDDEKKSSISQLPSQQHIIFNEHNMMMHLRTFQDIAMNNGGNRAVGSAGGRESAKYIIEQTNRAGFRHTVTAFKNSRNQNGQNIIVEIPGKSNDTIILIGAHYDSVQRSAGINDNASGVSVLLELMDQLNQKKIQPNHTIRLAFWDAEETGLDGAKVYASKLKEAQLKQIKAYINVDMVGTKDPIAMIPSVNKVAMLKELEQQIRESARETGNAVDEGNLQQQLDEIRQMPTHPNDLALNQSLGEFFKIEKLIVRESRLINARTDIGAFIGKVPITGFTFLSHTSGEELVRCYHKPCDTREMIEPKSLSISGKAVVFLLKNLKAL